MRPGGLLFHLSYHKMPGFDSPEGRSGAIFSTGRRPAAEETDKMQTQQLQQNMKEKVKVFEDGGIRLLKKGQKGLVHAIFSRFGLVLVLLLLQFGALFSLLRWFGQLLPHYLGGTALVTAAMVIYLLNIDMDNSVRITWLVVVALAPVLGVPLFWYTKSELGHNALKRRLLELEGLTSAQLPQDEQAVRQLEAEDPGAASLARYLRGRGGGFPVYRNTETTYFPSGEAKFEEMLRQLETAQHYIFLEYFIVDEGLMWGRVLEVLVRKAAQGVDVRVLYDGMLEISTLPWDYPRRLEKLGIRCKAFAPIQPFLSTHYNYRDHRKILVIDGKVAFTGGVNLADEYINRKERFGHWKDTAILLRGEAVQSFTLMFLQMWNLTEKEPRWDEALLPSPPVEAEGYVMPYCDCPLDDYKVGESVYMDILNRAKDYVHIMTPYLILDNEMETALKFAAQRGVDVKLILPGIPDKKAAYALAKSHYQYLTAAGVKLYEYTPGFVHAKIFASDDVKAVVGTINLDYRSLYHHFECAAYLYGGPTVGDVERDFQRTLEQCRRVTPETIRHEKLGYKLGGSLMKLVAPLL